MPFDSGGMELFFAVGAVLALLSLVRSWKSFADDDLTAGDQRVAMQAAVFLVPPAVVLLHELGHVAATVAVGGRVTSFHYGLFEGSVGFEGVATAGQVWFVALAGNLVSLGLGLAMTAVGAGATRLRRPFRYALVVSGLLEVAFALVGYPVLSESARFGDWLLVYDFGATPGLSTATLVAHVALAVAVWRWWRSGLRRTLLAVGSGTEDRLAALAAAVDERPAELTPRLELARLFAAHGAPGLAAATLDEAVGPTGGPPRLHLARARLAIAREHWNEAVLATRQGLAAASLKGDGAAAGTADVAAHLWANQGLALTQMERPALALDAFDHVEAALADDPRVRCSRAVARLGAGDAEGARTDLAAVVASLPPDDPAGRWARARLREREPAVPGGAGEPGRSRRRTAPRAPVSAV